VLQRLIDGQGTFDIDESYKLNRDVIFVLITLHVTRIV